MSAVKDSGAVDDFPTGTIFSVSGPQALPPLKVVQLKRVRARRCRRNRRAQHVRDLQGGT